MTVQELVEKLKTDCGYPYIPDLESDGIYMFGGSDFRIGVSDNEAYAPPNIYNRVAIDGVFDKWSSVPVSVPLPTNDSEYQQLLRLIDWAASKEGIKASAYYTRDQFIRDYATF